MPSSVRGSHGSAQGSAARTATRPARPRPASAPSYALRPASSRSVLYSFTCLDDKSSIFNSVARELVRRGYWREVQASAGNISGHMRLCEVILAHCHGKRVKWSEVGAERPQTINYLRGSRSITLKAELALLLRDCLAANPAEEPFSPLSYILYPRKNRSRRPDPGDERDDFLWEMHLREKAGVDNVWIVKVTHGAKGNGVEVFDNGNEVCDYVDSAYGGTGFAVVVQKYVENPLLIYGYKFDIRVWVVVDVCQGVFLYRDGVLRLSSTPYNPDDLADTFSHLTNHCIQQRSPHYENLVEGNEMFFPEFERFLAREHPDIDFDADILDQIKGQILRTVQAAWGDLRMNRPGGFQLYGFDFMVDTEIRTWLLEVNGAPAAAAKLKDRIARDIVTLCVDSRFPPPPVWGLSGSSRTHPPTHHGFDMISSISSLDRKTAHRK